MAQSHKRSMSLIHVAKRNLALGDVEYRRIIREIGGAESGSAKDLTPKGIDAVLDHFRDLGWLPTKLGGQKLTGLSGFRPGMASQKQIRMLLSIWIDAARNPSEDAFNHFLQNRFGITHYRFLPQNKVAGIKIALEAMRDRKPEEDEFDESAE